MPTQRMRQINSVLRDYFATALLRLVELPPGVVVSITKVHTTADLHYCTVFLSIVPDDQAGSALELIRRRNPDIIADVVGHITFRAVPRFRYELDDVERQASKIERLLDSLPENQ